MPVSTRKIRIGVGGWFFAPWRETFYPRGLKPAEFLSFASRQFTSIEVNSTFYRMQSVSTFQAWHDATPEGFLFALKAPRSATQTRDVARAAVAVERFLGSGIVVLGPKLGPIAWQFPPTRRFDAEELAAFLDLLPSERGKWRLRHAIEASDPSFDCEECRALLRARGVARVLLHDTDPAETADFVYARLKGTMDDEPAGLSVAELDAWAGRIRRWNERRECFIYIIAGAKARNPAAAAELLRRLR